MDEILILEGARTPFAAWARGTRGDGRKGGALAALDPFDLAAAAVKGALAKAGLSPDALDFLVFGNAYHAGPNACYGGRYVTHRAGVPPEVPSLAVNLACGAGLQAVISAADHIRLGKAGIVAASGADAPSLLRRDVFVPSFKDTSCGKHIAETAQDLAREYGFSREDQDRWALHSHQAAFKARERGVFKEESVPAGDAVEDDAIIPSPEPAFFAGSKLLFEVGTATHANTHAIVDGGSALILASAAAARKADSKPLGRYLGGAVIGLPPERMAYASVLAVRKLLALTGLNNSDIDLFEINETYASQVLIDMKELSIPEERMNVNGGALALGHPFAGTGCRLVLTLLKELRRRALKRGVASICVGGGLGIAVAVEA